MSRREIDRAELMGRIEERRLTQREAAQTLGLSVRQVQRLYARFKQDGAPGLASKKRGKPSNRKLPDALRKESLAVVRVRYTDFGPTLAHEKLTEDHGLAMSVETLRSSMIADGLWLTRRERRKRVTVVETEAGEVQIVHKGVISGANERRLGKRALLVLRRSVPAWTNRKQLHSLSGGARRNSGKTHALCMKSRPAVRCRILCSETVGQDTATKEASELAFYEQRGTALVVALLEFLQQRLQVVTHHPMQHGVLGRAAEVAERGHSAPLPSRGVPKSDRRFHACCGSFVPAKMTDLLRTVGDRRSTPR